MTPADAKLARQRFVDALIFNWFIAGTDAHAKNYSLLLRGSQVRFAPLYDLASALPYPGLRQRSLRLAMKLGHGYAVVPHHDSWPRAARAWGMDPEALHLRVLTLGRAIPDAFRDAASSPEVSRMKATLPATLVDRIAHRVARCRALISGPPLPS